MYSGDAPPSFSSGGLKHFDQDQFPVDAQPQPYGVHNDQSWQNQPPSQGSMGHGQGNSVNQFQDGSIYRGLGQPDPFVVVDSEKGPSFTALGHGQGISYNQDGMSNRDQYGVSGQPLSVGAMVKGGFSNPSGGGGDHYGGDSAPGLSDVARRDKSQTGGSSVDIQGSSDPLEFVGMSLVGKNFKKYYPDAYYKEKDDY
ncbi:unnamed protein product [Lactuca virosa]|uniref:YTH domain-containing protein n=1 Tax=Lactuca virosa TaxID=75947 RepID=A0AAU9ND42_9ASTR|nr:unnamed protein product [Lactuca virosa]